MARTKAQERKWIEEIIACKVEIDRLTMRKRALADKLGHGTWRIFSHPGLKVLISESCGGWRVSWKAVAGALAKRLGLSEREFEMAQRGHRKMTYGSPTCSVAKDKTNRLNPKLKTA